MAQLQTCKNPQEAIAEIVMNNPQYKDAFEILSKIQNPRDAFFALAKRKGVDPQLALNFMK